ncbi:MAG: membrane protein insertase YidC [Candidatus Omnitrophica bacterium]|nr:membrane protein insertase YidC [Candidatus Omnitrophota bacterium]
MDQKRLIIAVVLSVLIVLGFQKFVKPPVRNVAAVRIDQATRPISQTSETTATFAEPQKTKRISSDEIETVAETDKYLLIFSNIGGTLKSIELKEYDTAIIKNLEPPVSIFSMISKELDPDMAFGEWNLSEGQGRITYTYQTPRKIQITKEYLFHNTTDYIELRIVIDNLSDASVATDYSIIGPSGLEQASSMRGRNFLEFNGKVNGTIMRKSRIKGDQLDIGGIISWIALKNRYFTLVLVPPPAADELFIRQVGDKLTTGLRMKARTIGSRSVIQDKYVFYIGPLIKKRLAALGLGIDEVVNFGFFGAISIVLLTILRGIHSVVRNWGVAIIGVTFLINLLMFPLTRKSFRSMQSMQELQPHMEKLRKLHKDNPQKLNQEMVALYRQYNVNPFGGCLPMLLQLPIFFAFYQTLLRSIELKNASFLWIKDLSAPDALFSFPQALPFIGQNFNLLPLLTVAVMVFQQRVSTAHGGPAGESEMAKQQKFMALFMPLFFGIILYNFPSGLVLYWLTNSSLMMGEQLLIKKHMKAS